MIDRSRAWMGALLLVGLLCHVVAAHLNGGSRIAYQHHILGFFAILVVTGVVIAVLGRLLWRERHDITLLTIGAVQTIVGILVVYSQWAKP